MAVAIVAFTQMEGLFMSEFTPDEIIEKAKESGLRQHIPFFSDKEVEVALCRFAKFVADAKQHRVTSLNQELLKTIKECRNAIQGGQKIEQYDNRGFGYQQYFGQAFIYHLNAVISAAAEHEMALATSKHGSENDTTTN